CYRLGVFELAVINCPPVVPEGYSPNHDGINDTFEIVGLYDIFPDFEIEIFSRYGNIVYRGNNSIPEWDGTTNHGIGGNEVPTGVYYYVLNLHDPDYDIIKGWVYLNR
ncbi:MAG TPA: gliding motility-associated C-terminal domain-containing protein, partial [Flavobacteriaceae bacterium]|nr:gliding motility-associated C-terminal domain-containing protein [Flavobacteriaceae bacterium]